jgi:hypothetical protein
MTPQADVRDNLPKRQRQMYDLIVALGGRAMQPTLLKEMWLRHSVGTGQASGLLGALRRKSLIRLEPLRATGTGQWVLCPNHQDSKDVGAAVPVYQDGPCGPVFVWLCPLCGQPGGEGDRCNSGIHQGPDDGNEGVAMVRSLTGRTTNDQDSKDVAA